MKRVLAVISAWLILVGTVAAQTNTGGTIEDRPATTTISGDTGLWFVPSGEVLRSRRISFSVARTEADFEQGFTDVSTWPITAGVGIGGRAEIFGSMSVVTRIDRDTAPLFFDAANNEPGGLVNEFPAARQSFSGNKLGDLLLGGKVNFASQAFRMPLAAAVRGMVKVPTADEEEGIGTGEMDWVLDGVASREIGIGADVSGYVGYIWRGNPEGFDLSNGFRWGVGGAFPSRSRVRLNVEWFGEMRDADTITADPGILVAEDGTLNPFLSENDNQTNLAMSVTFQGRGLFFDAGIVFAFGIDERSEFGPGIPDKSRDAIGYQFKIGWHRGVGSYRPAPPAIAALPAPPAPAPAPEPAPAPNSQPALQASCVPCVVEQGGTLTLLVTGQDPDGDPLSFRWSTPAGTIANPAALDTTMRAPDQTGSILVTVIADDGRGGLARGTVSVDVVERERPVGTAGAQAIENILFDFDQATLRPESLAILNGVVNEMRANAGLRIDVSGHADDRGTAEYNLALGERRANAVRDYLVSQGIAPGRITTRSLGEEQPLSTDRTEAGRQLNRRAVLERTAVQ